jgi:hypothetical protein
MSTITESHIPTHPRDIHVARPRTVPAKAQLLAHDTKQCRRCHRAAADAPRSGPGLAPAECWPGFAASHARRRRLTVPIVMPCVHVPSCTLSVRHASPFPRRTNHSRARAQRITASRLSTRRYASCVMRRATRARRGSAQTPPRHFGSATAARRRTVLAVKPEDSEAEYSVTVRTTWLRRYAHERGVEHHAAPVRARPGSRVFVRTSPFRRAGNSFSALPPRHPTILAQTR